MRGLCRELLGIERLSRDREKNCVKIAAPSEINV